MHRYLEEDCDSNMVKYLLILLCLTLTACAGSFSRLSSEDLKYQYILTAETGLDLYQTSLFDEYPLIEEENPLLSSNPSDEELITMGSLAIAGQWFVTWALPPKHRRKWQFFMIGIETRCVVSNRIKGVKIIK